ncbi:DUF397 domain-containing protein [Streptomyces glomeratus]|uniref:DUF397 domain-containing protein n=1 Tax=Streptomyces glomeratus TaxID=284452 RepID=A0ABP6M4P5_9ACTN|nr:DUF397 domain-containing protein [Streptomyces glomeratus]MCF1511499.1 DUF397 domain-containing protein [Streptomyces glomeratus]
MNTQEPSELMWFKSSYSDGEGGECVEVAPCPTAIHVRDSKHDPDTGPTLTLRPVTWEAFIGFAAR